MINTVFALPYMDGNETSANRQFILGLPRYSNWNRKTCAGHGRSCCWVFSDSTKFGGENLSWVFNDFYGKGHAWINQSHKLYRHAHRLCLHFLDFVQSGFPVVSFRIYCWIARFWMRMQCGGAAWQGCSLSSVPWGSSFYPLVSIFHDLPYISYMKWPFSMGSSPNFQTPTGWHFQQDQHWFCRNIMAYQLFREAYQATR